MIISGEVPEWWCTHAGAEIGSNQQQNQQRRWLFVRKCRASHPAIHRAWQLVCAQDEIKASVGNAIKSPNRENEREFQCGRVNWRLMENSRFWGELTVMSLRLGLPGTQFQATQRPVWLSSRSPGHASPSTRLLGRATWEEATSRPSF